MGIAKRLPGAMKLDNGLTQGLLQVDAIGNVSSTSTALGLYLWETDASSSADIRNKNSGKVGVGSTNDVLTSKFQVGGSTARVCIGDAFDATYYMNGYIGFNAGKPSPTSNWIIESNGGTATSPNNAADAIIADGEGNLRFVALPKVNSGGSFWHTPTNEDMHNAARMIIRSDGKVIIGSEQNLSIISFSGCKKETSRHKIMDKVYDIESLTINGAASTIVAKTKSGYSYFSFIIDDFGDQSIKLYPCSCNNFSGDIGVHGSWSLNNKMLTLYFLGQPTYSIAPFYSGEVVNWNIIQISTDQLWLEVVFQGKDCNLHLTT